jgi:hypothetical protein
MCRHIATFALAAFIGIGAAHSQTHAAPSIVCDEPAVNFGTVNNNTQSLVHTFTVWNRGDSDLQINGLQSSCGCTTANAGDSTVRPGASTTIKASFALLGRKGAQKKEIRLASNDPLTPLLLLQIACDIRLDIDPDVTGFFFSRVATDSQNVSRVVRLRAASNVTFRVTSVDTSSAPSVVVEVATVETGSVYSVTATVRMDALPAGLTQERITIRTDHPSFQSIELPVSLYKAEEVMVVPNELPLLDTAFRQTTVRRDIFLRIQGTNRWEFFDVESVGDFKVTVEDRVPGRCRIVLSELSGVDEAGTLRLAVTVRSPDTGSERRIEVPLRRYVPKRQPGAGTTQPAGRLETGRRTVLPTL